MQSTVKPLNQCKPNSDSQVQVSVLGATGSVGQATLNVIRKHPQRFQVFAVTACQNEAALFDICMAFKPVFAVMVEEKPAASLSIKLKQTGIRTRVLAGASALDTVAEHESVHVVVAAIVGAAGLASTLAAVRASKRLLLANKESLVMAGPLFQQTLGYSEAQVLPLDSEHNAIFQCLPRPELNSLMHTQVSSNGVKRVVLTASGGPFLKRPLSKMDTVTPEEACTHPNWRMGRKISVDSATMMNKGLEWIEACYLFNLEARQLDVLVHPQSIVHAMVEYEDSSILAHMSQPNMQIPITHALAWPDRIDSGVASLNFAELGSLEFLQLDPHRFPCLSLAKQAYKAGPLMPVVLNGANEIAVAAFLNGQLSFTRIAWVIESVLDQLSSHYSNKEPEDLDTIFALDRLAREKTMQCMHRKSVWNSSSTPSLS